jgi:hypothetical protein
MTEGQKKPESSERIGFSSRYWKTFLVVLAAILTFGGPYAVYLMTSVLDISYFVSIALGFALFIAGLIIIWHLIRNKVIT